MLSKTAWAKLSLVSNISGWKTDLAPLRITACLFQRNGLHRTLKSCFCLTLQGQLGTLRQHLQGHVLMAIAEKKAQKYTESAPKPLCSTIHNTAYKASFHSSETPQEQPRQEHGKKKILKL